MIVSHKNKFIFLKTRKTAGTSTFVFFENFTDENDIVSEIKEYRDGLLKIEPRNHIKKFSLIKDNCL